MAGLREQKKKLARDSLAQAALELFSEKGFERTTVDEIAARAGISRRSFFRYFSNKEEAAFPLQNERLRQFRELLQAHDVRRNGVAAVRDACLAIGRLYSAERDARVARHRLVNSSPALRAFEQAGDVELEQILVGELTQGDPSPERVLQAKLFAAAVLALVRVVLSDWFRTDGASDLEALGRQAFRNLETGFQLNQFGVGALSHPGGHGHHEPPATAPSASH